jgi:hypothetical protein
MSTSEPALLLDARALLHDAVATTLARARAEVDKSVALTARATAADVLHFALLSNESVYGQIGEYRERLHERDGVSLERILQCEELLIDEAASYAFSSAGGALMPAAVTSSALMVKRATLEGIWYSRYQYQSSESTGDLSGEHYMWLREEQPGWIRGTSMAHTIGSSLDLHLRIDEGWVFTGFWAERTSKRSTYFGAIQLVADAIRHRLYGAWVGFNRRYLVATGPWELQLVDEYTDEATRTSYNFRL